MGSNQRDYIRVVETCLRDKDKGDLEEDFRVKHTDDCLIDELP